MTCLILLVEALFSDAVGRLARLASQLRVFAPLFIYVYNILADCGLLLHRRWGVQETAIRCTSTSSARLILPDVLRHHDRSLKRLNFDFWCQWLRFQYVRLVLGWFLLSHKSQVFYLENLPGDGHLFLSSWWSLGPQKSILGPRRALLEGCGFLDGLEMRPGREFNSPSGGFVDVDNFRRIYRAWGKILLSASLGKRCIQWIHLLVALGRLSFVGIAALLKYQVFLIQRLQSFDLEFQILAWCNGTDPLKVVPMVVWVDHARPFCLYNFSIFVPGALHTLLPYVFVAITIWILANLFSFLALQMFLTMVLPYRKAKFTLPHTFLNWLVYWVFALVEVPWLEVYWVSSWYTLLNSLSLIGCLESLDSPGV